MMHQLPTVELTTALKYQAVANPLMLTGKTGPCHWEMGIWVRQCLEETIQSEFN